MWSKGAVVILKHGDEAMTNSMINGMESGMALQRINSREVEALKRCNFFLRRKNRKSTDAMIADARRKYGNNYILPKWADKAVGWILLFAYPMLLVLDKLNEEYAKYTARKKRKPYYRKAKTVR